VLVVVVVVMVGVEVGAKEIIVVMSRYANKDKKSWERVNICIRFNISNME
jgi:hypothetical protein